MSKFSENDRRQLGLLVGPSWLSGLIAVAVGMVVSLGVIIAFSVNNSGLQQQLLAWQANQPAPAVNNQQILPENDHPTLQGSWPLLLVWGLTGLGVYVIVMAIVRDIGKAEELRESLNYVNARPQAALSSAARHLLLRTVAAVLLIVFAVFFVRQVLPYSITTAHASASDIKSVDGGLYALLSFAVVALSLHGITVLLRLAVGRTRLFSGV